jgi:hypothetical protein
MIRRAEPAAHEVANRSTRRLEAASATSAVMEVLAAWALIEATLWTSGTVQLRLFWISAAFILITTIIHRPKLTTLGLGLRGLRSSLWVIPAILVCAAAAIGIASRLGTLHPLFGVKNAVSHSTSYIVWAIFQQFILQSYFFLRFERLVNSGHLAVILSAGLFALVHIPNPVLVSVCLVAGWCACEIFRRHRNIYPLGVAHAILGLTIAITVPDQVQRHMRVGIGYLHYPGVSTKAKP